MVSLFKSGFLYIPQKLPVLVASTPLAHQQGLKHRQLPDITAFVFDSLKSRYFWMQDTPSHLDIYFCRQGKVVAQEEGVPYSLAHVGGHACDLVLEIPQESGYPVLDLGSSVALQF